MFLVSLRISHMKKVVMTGAVLGLVALTSSLSVLAADVAGATTDATVTSATPVARKQLTPAERVRVRFPKKDNHATSSAGVAIPPRVDAKPARPASEIRPMDSTRPVEAVRPTEDSTTRPDRSTRPMETRPMEVPKPGNTEKPKNEIRGYVRALMNLIMEGSDDNGGSTATARDARKAAIKAALGSSDYNAFVDAIKPTQDEFAQIMQAYTTAEKAKADMQAQRDAMKAQRDTEKAKREAQKQERDDAKSQRIMPPAPQTGSSSVK